MSNKQISLSYLFVSHIQNQYNHYLQGLDGKFVETACQFHSSHAHFSAGGKGNFIIKHYAGEVRYNSAGFGDANREALRQELVELCQRDENDTALKR